MLLRVLPLAAFGAALLLIGASQWPTGSTPSAAALTNCDATPISDTAVAQMLVLINQARAADSPPKLALKISASLNRAAAWMSQNMWNRPPLSHTDYLGRDPFQRMKDCGYTYGGVEGENVGTGTNDGQVMFNQFMASPGHRDNILSGSYHVIGIGQFNGFWTLDFGSYDDSGQADPPLPPSSQTPTNTPTATATATPTRTPTPAGPRPRAFLPMLTFADGSSE